MLDTPLHAARQQHKAANLLKTQHQQAHHQQRT
jgi:hypothetical protein